MSRPTKVHQVFKCLACVDTKRVSYKQKDASRLERMLLDLKLFTNSHLFWGNTQILKCSSDKKKWYPIEKANTQLNYWWKKLGYLPNWLESLSVSLVFGVAFLIKSAPRRFIKGEYHNRFSYRANITGDFRTRWPMNRPNRRL